MYAKRRDDWVQLYTKQLTPLDMDQMKEVYGLRIVFHPASKHPQRRLYSQFRRTRAGAALEGPMARLARVIRDDATQLTLFIEAPEQSEEQFRIVSKSMQHLVSFHLGSNRLACADYRFLSHSTSFYNGGRRSRSLDGFQVATSGLLEMPNLLRVTESLSASGRRWPASGHFLSPRRGSLIPHCPS